MRADAVRRHITQHNGDAALGQRRAPGRRHTLGHDDDPQAQLRRVQSRRQPRYPTTHDDQVDSRLPRAHRAEEMRAHSPTPGLPMAIIRRTAALARVASSGSTRTSSVPSRKDRSNASGVIIFM